MCERSAVDGVADTTSVADETSLEIELTVNMRAVDYETDLCASAKEVTLVQNVYHVQGDLYNEVIKTKMQNCDGAFVNNVSSDPGESSSNLISAEEVDREAGNCIVEVHKQLFETEIIEFEIVGIKKPSKFPLPELMGTTKDTMLAKPDVDEAYKPKRKSFIKHRWEGNRVQFEEIILHCSEGCTLVGCGGAGKSTMLKKFAKDVVKGKIRNCRHIKLVLRIELKNLDGNEQGGLGEVLLLKATNCGTLNARQKKILVEWVKLNPNKVLIICDGYDQLARPITKQDKVAIDCYSTATTNQFLHGIFDKSILRGAAVILSMREYALQHIPEKCVSERILKLVGLTNTNIDRLVIAMSDKDVLQRIKEGDLVIYVMCASPLFLTFVVWAKTNNCLKSNPPETKSGILMCIVLNFLTSENHIYGNTVKNLHKLSRLAFYGTSQRKVVFTTDDICAHDLTTDDLKDMFVGLPGNMKGIGNKTKLMAGKYLRYFLHQSLQEILSAIHIVTMTPQEFDKFLSNMNGFNWEEVKQLLFGLLFRSENQDMLCQLDGQIGNKQNELQTLKRGSGDLATTSENDHRTSPTCLNHKSSFHQAFYNFIKENLSISKRADEFFGDGAHGAENFESVRGGFKDMKEHRRIALKHLQSELGAEKKVGDLPTMRLLYEAGDASIIRYHVDKICLKMADSFDAFCIGRILANSPKLEFLHLMGTDDTILQVLLRSCEYKIPKINELRISYSRENVVGGTLATIANNANSLELFDCAFTFNEMQEFVDKLQKSKTFTSVKFYQVPIKGAHVRLLKQLMKHIHGPLWLDTRAELIRRPEIPKKHMNCSVKFGYK